MRGARTGDAGDIAAVHVGSWQAAYRGLVPDDLLEGLSVAEHEAKWRQLIAEGRVLVLVAEQGGRIAGFCSAVVPSRDRDAGRGTAEVAALYVAPALWRRGVGTALVRAVLQKLRDGGCSEAMLWVFEANAAGRRFYSDLGWQPDGAQGVHERSGQKTVRLRIALRPGPAAD